MRDSSVTTTFPAARNPARQGRNDLGQPSAKWRKHRKYVRYKWHIALCASLELRRAEPALRDCRSGAASPNAGLWLPTQAVLTIQSWTLRQAHPRAPPIPVVAPSWTLVVQAHLTRLWPT